MMSIIKEKIKLWLLRRKAAKSLKPLKKKAETIEEEKSSWEGDGEYVQSD